MDSFAASAVRLNLAPSLGSSCNDSRSVFTTSLADFNVGRRWCQSIVKCEKHNQ
ncbi:hypothetical protein IC582_001822 [Cucumis melo]